MIAVKFYGCPEESVAWKEIEDYGMLDLEKGEDEGRKYIKVVGGFKMMKKYTRWGVECYRFQDGTDWDMMCQVESIEQKDGSRKEEKNWERSEVLYSEVEPATREDLLRALYPGME